MWCCTCGWQWRLRRTLLVPAGHMTERSEQLGSPAGQQSLSTHSPRRVQPVHRSPGWAAAPLTFGQTRRRTDIDGQIERVGLSIQPITAGRHCPIGVAVCDVVGIGQSRESDSIRTRTRVELLYRHLPRNHCESPPRLENDLMTGLISVNDNSNLTADQSKE